MKHIFKLNRYLFLANKWLYISHGLMSVLWCVSPVCLAYLVSLLMDDLAWGRALRYVTVLAAYTVLTYVNIYFAWKSGIVEAKITSYVERTMHLSLLGRTVREPGKVRKEPGYLVDILENDVPAVESLLLVLMELFCSVASFLGAVWIVWQINAKLTVFGFIPIVLISSLIGYLGDRFKERYALARDDSLELSETMSELVNNHEVLRFLGKQEDILSYFREKCRQRGRSRMRRIVFLALADHTGELVNHLSVLLILILAVFLLKDAALTVGALTLFVNSIQYGFSFLHLYEDVVNSLKATEDSLGRVCSLAGIKWEEMPECLAKTEETGAKTRAQVKNGADGKGAKKTAGGNASAVRIPAADLCDGSCALRFIKFRMTAEDEVHDFQIREHELMVVSGGNGSGKTYFLNCITGQNAFEGEIRMGVSGRMQIGILEQAGTLFHASIRDNVTLFQGDTDPTDALEKGNLLENSRNWDVYSDEKIGVNGKRLSEGQRQRVAIARAYENGKDLLVWDSPFLFLDKENRKVILDHLRKSGRTAVVVSNDEELIEEADVQVVIADRRIERICYKK